MTFCTVTFRGLKKFLDKKILPKSESFPAHMKRSRGARTLNVCITCLVTLLKGFFYRSSYLDENVHPLTLTTLSIKRKVNSSKILWEDNPNLLLVGASGDCDYWDSVG